MDHWFEPLADHLGSAYLRYSFTKGTVQEVDAITELVGLAAGARVLDVGCGPGRHSLEFARRGYEVVGVDIAAKFVDLASTAAEAEELTNCRFLRADARELGALGLGAFDLVLSLCQGAFGLTAGSVVDPDIDFGATRELDEPILAAMAECVSPSGRVVVSAFSSYFQIRHTTYPPSGSATSTEPVESFDAESGVSHEWTKLMNPDDEEREAEIWTVCYTPRELRLLTRAVGLEPIAVYGVTPGGYGPNPPNLDCPEFLLIASPEHSR